MFVRWNKPLDRIDGRYRDRCAYLLGPLTATGAPPSHHSERWRVSLLFDLRYSFPGGHFGSGTPHRFALQAQ